MTTGASASWSALSIRCERTMTDPAYTIRNVKNGGTSSVIGHTNASRMAAAKAVQW